MSTQHTTGPICTDEKDHDHPFQNILLLGEHGRRIATIWIDDAPVHDFNAEQAANARRLVACWNACEGISTENLEDNLPVKYLATHYNAVLAQRDRLLAALEELCDVLGKCAETEKPRALIAECHQSLKVPKSPEESIPGIEVLYVDATLRPAYWRS